jgi:hypothetical protein
MWWVLGIVLQPIAQNTEPWLRYLSFSYDLKQIGLAIFRLGDDLKTAQDNIPILGDMLHAVSASTRAALNNPGLGGALAGLALMLVVAGVVISKRVNPE